MSEEDAGLKKSIEYYRQFFKRDQEGNWYIRHDFIDELRNIESKRLQELFYLLTSDLYDREYVRRLDSFLKGNILESLLRREFNKIRGQVFDALAIRSGRKCHQCGSVNDLTVDHILSLAKGGTNESDNFQLLCRSCNSKKGTK